MTSTIVSEFHSSSRTGGNAAQVAKQLAAAAAALAKYPALEVLSVDTMQSPSRELTVHLVASSMQKHFAFEAIVADRQFTHFTSEWDSRRAWWKGTIDGVAVIWSTPAPASDDAHVGVSLARADCVLPSTQFRSDRAGAQEFLEHVRTVHAGNLFDAKVPLAAIEIDGRIGANPHPRAEAS